MIQFKTTFLIYHNLSHYKLVSSNNLTLNNMTDFFNIDDHLLEQIYVENMLDDLQDDSNASNCSWVFKNASNFGHFHISTNSTDSELLRITKMTVPYVCRNIRQRLNRISNDEMSISDMINLCLNPIVKTFFGTINRGRAQQGLPSLTTSCVSNYIRGLAAMQIYKVTPTVFLIVFMLKFIHW